MERVDIVIFGATGFTGKCAVLEMARISRQYPDITWGVAGRSQSKLETLMKEVAQATGLDHSHIRVIIADVSDSESLLAMCSQARVLANCCGPYRTYGEQVVRAAVESRCHHVDVTGEPQFIESMQLKYDGVARDSGVYVISACGFDSIPNDMGVAFLQNNFGGTVNSVESYIRTNMDPKYSGDLRKRGTIHYGTWDSLVQSLAHWNELAHIRKQLYPEKLPALKPKLQRRAPIHRSPGRRWSIPFPGSDNSVVYRSQRALAASGERPAQFKAYLEVGALWQALALVFGAVGLFIMTRVGFLCRLLLEHPRLFSVGLVSHEGPTTELMQHTTFSVTLTGEGWGEGTSQEGPLNRRVIAKVSGTNPGYGATVTALLFSAITILRENHKMPGNGGVLTTAVAFKDTSLIEKLNENGIKFEIIETTSI